MADDYKADFILYTRSQLKAAATRASKFHFFQKRPPLQGKNLKAHLRKGRPCV